MMELLYKQFNVDKIYFQQVIDDGICYVSSISHFLIGLQGKIYFYMSQEFFMKTSLSPKTTVYQTIGRSAQRKIANFT